MNKEAFDLRELVALGHGCRTFLYQQLSAGKLIARKRGRRTVVLRADLDAWVASLPVVEPRKAANSMREDRMGKKKGKR